MAEADYRRLTCAGCSSAFEQLIGQGRPRRKCYSCSPRSVAKRVERMRPQKECARESCRQSFFPALPYQRYCSRACCVEAGNVRQAQRKADAMAAQPVRSCKQCGCSFGLVYGTKRRLYCSRECEERRRQAERSGTSHRRRARRYGVPYEHVNRIKVFERDRWRCKLCGAKVKQSTAELDHILPLSKGGGHTYTNTQCSCRPCNQSKKDRPLGQTRLFG